MLPVWLYHDNKFDLTQLIEVYVYFCENSFSPPTPPQCNHFFSRRLHKAANHIFTSKTHGFANLNDVFEMKSKFLTKLKDVNKNAQAQGKDMHC